jgi:hypothetical protein
MVVVGVMVGFDDCFVFEGGVRWHELVGEFLWVDYFGVLRW